MSDMPKRIWAGPYEPSDGFMGGQYCNGYEGMSYATEYIRADIAGHREAELADMLEWVIRDGLRWRLEGSDMVVEEARALLAKRMESGNY